ncbi:MAG: hypothetical protein RLZZ347_61 [Candidatus Parcubacteria bacterium]|jgi:regulator of protease activity HflC (stomatin/prohibitin superfamily)
MNEIIAQHPIQFGIAVLVLLAMIPLWIYILAKKGIGWVMLPEGQILTIMSGKTQHEFISCIRDYSIDPSTGVIKHTPGVAGPNGWYGIYWIGVPPFRSIYTYPFHWNKWTKKKDAKEHTIEARDGDAMSVYFRFPYAIEITDAETADGAKINLRLLVTIEAVNVETMLFKTPDWLANATAKITAVATDYLRSQTSVDFRANTPAHVNQLSARVMGLNTTLTSAVSLSLLEMCGVKFNSAEFLGYDVAGGLADAAEKTARAQLEGEANIKAAELAAKVLATKTEADAKAIERLATAGRTKGMADVEVEAARYERLQKHDPQARRGLADAIQKHQGTLVLGGGAQLLVEDDTKKGGTP